MAIVVLGMHRSGTSLVASILHHMGVYMGNSFLHEDELNPWGYWEDAEILELNKRIIGSAVDDGTWNDFITLKQIVAQKETYKEEIKQIVTNRERIKNKIAWGFKDPRTCYTIWAWSDFLPPNTKYVIVHRNKEKVVDSLLRAHGEGQWSKLYNHYWNHIKAFMSRDEQFYHIGYESLVNKDLAPIIVVGLAAFVGTPLNVEVALEKIIFKS